MTDLAAPYFTFTTITMNSSLWQFLKVMLKMAL